MLYEERELTHPYPLPRGERVLGSPSFDGRGMGEGDNYLISLTEAVIS